MNVIPLVETVLDLKLLRKSFLGISLGILAFIPVDLVMIASKGKVEPNSEPQAQADTVNASSLESLSSYESAFQKSVLFGLYHPESNLPVLQSSIAELAKDYRLKGIIILDEPEAILEDARTQKSTFVKIGDKVGELTVKEIKEGSLVLSYYGEEKEMRIE